MKNINKKGFTIIEVVLVLAIAGLIFLIVFLAVPQLQKSRRDTQRKNDAGRALAALEARAGNTNGAYPAADATSWNTFAAAYLTNDGGTFGDPETAAYTFTDATPVAAGVIQYAINANCNAAGVVTGGQSLRNIAVAVFQENGGSYCQDNN